MHKGVFRTVVYFA
uniref:Uncharacterized protein n=1 Tax=Anguilla anguilla TaxID=7936 RepID=A0A0E9UUY7_ANGAN